MVQPCTQRHLPSAATVLVASQLTYPHPLFPPLHHLSASFSLFLYPPFFLYTYIFIFCFCFYYSPSGWFWDITFAASSFSLENDFLNTHYPSPSAPEEEPNLLVLVAHYLLTLIPHTFEESRPVSRSLDHALPPPDYRNLLCAT